MTLILTMFSKRGIVHVSDSNLSDANGLTVAEGKKVFAVPRLHAGVSCAGSYAVGGVPMDTWMEARISEYEANASGTLPGFAEFLRRALDHSMTAVEKNAYCFVHVAGYTRTEDGWRHEMYVLSNTRAIDQTDGNYLPPDQTFRDLEEEFQAKELATPEARAAFERGHLTPIYVNGYPPGRMAYMGLMAALPGFLSTVWSQRAWGFQPPRTLADGGVYLRLHLAVISGLFEMGQSASQLIGGPAQTVLVPPPLEDALL